MEETRPLPDPVEEGWKFPRWLTALIAVAVLVLIVLAFIIPPAPEVSVDAAPSLTGGAVRVVGQIEAAMESYAVAHGGRYPTGKSSTEVFQKLLDEHFVTDPRLFYLEMTGKAPADSNQLLPVNVAYDVTVPVDITTSPYVPVVFSTGYRIEYKPGGRAMPLAAGIRPDACSAGIAVAYPGPQAGYRPSLKSDKGTIQGVVPAEAKLDSGPYTQLTPDGQLTAP